MKDEPPEGRGHSPGDLWQQPSGTVVVHPARGVAEVRRPGRHADTERHDRVVTVEGGEKFALPAPEDKVNALARNVAGRLVRPADAEISAAPFTTV